MNINYDTVYKLVRPIVYRNFISHPHFVKDNSLTPDDLIQEGVLGALNAISSYDDSQQCSITTWIYINASQAITRSLNEYGQVPVPHSSRDRGDTEIEEIRVNLPEEWEELLGEGLSSTTENDIHEFLIEVCLTTLNPTSAAMVLYHYGLVGNEPLTLRTLADMYGLKNAASVKWRIEKALRKLSENRELRECLR